MLILLVLPGVVKKWERKILLTKDIFSLLFTLFLAAGMFCKMLLRV